MWILHVFATSSSRLVSSDEQLLAVLFEALEAYQLEIQGDIPAVGDLWNRSHLLTDTNYTGRKTKMIFSDHLARFLRRQLSGTVVNREIKFAPMTRTERANIPTC